MKDFLKLNKTIFKKYKIKYNENFLSSFNQMI